MDDSTLNQVVMIGYLVAGFIFLWASTGSGSSSEKHARFIAWISFGMHNGSLIWRWIRSYQLGYGHAPMTNRYESLIFFGWAVAAVYLMMNRYFRLRQAGAFMMILSAGMIGTASLMPGAESEITPLMPALQSNWLLFHVVTCFLGYASFAAAFGTGIYALLKNREPGAGDSQSESLDQMMHRSVMVGFLLLTLGIISGSAWAFNTWGRYWGWDPKEVWSLITWFVYAIFLHARMMKGWRGKRLAIIAIIGFLFVLFTFLGVNYLPIFKGLHSYA